MESVIFISIISTYDCNDFGKLAYIIFRGMICYDIEQQDLIILAMASCSRSG
jgi:hypothetical protein